MSAPKMQLVDWLDDLSVRFIVNLPKEELESIERICFQVEEAQWFYEDFIRPTDPQLPTMNLKQFCLAFFQHCPLFAEYDVNMYMQAFQNFLEYKSRVPVRGAILLNDTMDEVVLVRGWKKGANWSFPRGKINKAEDDLDCAIREVFEETGLDLEAAGLIPANKDVKSIDVSLREQSIKLFVVPNVPKETHFQPQTRKEIGGIQWYKLADLPTIKKVKHQQQHGEGHGENLASYTNKFYMVAPFLGPLRKQIAHWRKAKQAIGQQVVPQENMDLSSFNYGMPVANQQDPHANFALQGGQGDMDRLLSQLRQSKQAYREENLPEVMQSTNHFSGTMPLDPNPSWAGNQQPIQERFHPQMPGALTDPQMAHWMHQAPQGYQQNFDPATNHTLMQATHHLQHSHERPGMELPQTPQELVNSQPQMPPSPTHQHRPHNLQASSSKAPPPSFVFSPSQTQPADPSAAFSQQPSLPSVRPPGSQMATQLKSPAPYQQIDDSEFSIQSHVQDRSGPNVPEPSKLPPPKLTANSAKLLSLFKGKDQIVNKPAGAAEMSADPHSRVTSMAINPAAGILDAFKSSQQRAAAVPSPLSLAAERTITPALASPTELGANSPVMSRPKTSQQNALLDLFRSQSGRGLGTPSPALALGPPPSHPPAELSAAQSPAQTFSQFNERRAGSSEALAPPHQGKGSLQKRNSGSQNQAMSATVTGPLNISEQELHHKTGGRGHSTSASLHRAAGTTLTPGSVKILSRPGTSNGQGKKLESHDQASPKLKGSPRRSRPEKKQAQASPKPFQPQILKRPVEHSIENTSKELQFSPPQPVAPAPMTILRRGAERTSPITTPPIPKRSTPTIERGIVEAPSPMSRQTSNTEETVPVSAASPGPSYATAPFTFDRRASQTSEQKANLLSLFGNKNAMQATSLSNPTSSPGQQILGAKIATPTTAAQPAVSPISALPPRTRMGSMASVGSGDSITGRQTPQTTSDKDRKFLLGFLNNVANDSTP